MVLTFKDYLDFTWDPSEFLIGKPVFINGKPDQDQPLPRGRDWRIKTLFNKNAYEKNILCYCSFTISTNPRKLRYKIKSLLEDKPFVNFGNIYDSWEFERNQSDNENYINYIKRSKFCVSPEGNGIDCFRTWDALYEKSIPIVVDSEIMRRYQDLPILYTKDYTDITEDYLNDFYEKALTTKYDFSKLFLSYWRFHMSDERLSHFIHL
jgi:hypothetical protein